MKVLTCFKRVWVGVFLLALTGLPLGAKEVIAQVNSQNAPAKFALVIANSSYSNNRNLKNPSSDAALMVQSLRKLGFEVKEANDLDRSQLFKTVDDFASALTAGSTSLVYYAGHGMQIGGASYLLPVDMVVTSEGSVPLRAYPLKSLLERVSKSPSVVNIVVLDACRDNPFLKSTGVQYRNFSNLGLAPIQAPRGTLLAYSTAPGQLALDKSVYTPALASTLLEPKLSLEAIFKKTSNIVRQKTLDDQIPWVESSITEEYFFQPPDGVKVVAGRPLQVAGTGSNDKTQKRSANAAPSLIDQVWFRNVSEYEWSHLDWQIQQRFKNMTEDELPAMEHKAKSGSVVAQTTLGLFWLGGSKKITNSANGHVSRYQANNTKAVYWLRMAAKAGFPVAQTELGEMLYQGKGIDRDIKESRQMLELAAQANYPRAKLDLLQINMEEGKASGKDLEAALESVMKSTRPPVAPVK